MRWRVQDGGGVQLVAVHDGIPRVHQVRAADGAGSMHLSQLVGDGSRYVGLNARRRQSRRGYEAHDS
jgi:hypothetical protein